MIDPSTYENLGDSLVYSGENLNYEIGIEYLKLNESVIDDTNNIFSAKSIFLSATGRYIYNFVQSNIINDFIAQSYLAGINHSNWFASYLQKETGQQPQPGNIVNGSFLARPQNVIVDSIPAPSQLKGYGDHLSWYNIIKASANQKIESSGIQLLRSTNDIYRKVAAMVSEQQFKDGNIFTRRQMSQELLNQFADNGITGIVYKNGAKYSIDTYCEMLGRTITGRTALQASLNRYSELGYNLGIVSSHFRCCPLCEPYEGVILSLDGKNDKYPSIWDAELQGLFHPNCKHSVSAFFEGITPPIEVRMDQAERKLVNELGYKEAQKITYMAQEKQRYIERKIRQWKRREMMSISQINKDRAKSKIKEWQSIQRNHLKENTFLKRQYSREQIKTAH